MKSKIYSYMLMSLITIGTMLLLSSCAVDEAEGPPPASSIPTLSIIAEGKPSYQAGMPAGYWIWHDREGWHLRVTTDGTSHQFKGMVKTKIGFIQNFKPSNPEWRDKVQVEGERMIRFDFATKEGIEGFDWLNPSNCHDLELYIDGVSHPERVFVGASGDHPLAAAFEACR